MRGHASKNDIFHTNIQKYIWTITKVIFNYTGSPGEIIPQKDLGGLLFLTHTVDITD